MKACSSGALRSGLVFRSQPGGHRFDAAGLSYPTKFNLGETFELDFNDEWFAVAPGSPHGQTPKLGVLHPSLVRRARAAFEAAAGN